MVCSYLVYEGMGAEEALQRYANERTYNNEGVRVSRAASFVIAVTVLSWLVDVEFF